MNSNEEDFFGKLNAHEKFSPEYKELHIRPWMRLFARLIDIHLFSFIIGILSGIFYPPLVSNNLALNGLIILFLWFLVEPLFLCTLGTTLGKFLLSIHLTDLNGQKLKIFSAYKRSFGVWMAGLGFGIPIVSLFTLIFSEKRLRNTGTTYWDQNNFIVTHKKIGVFKKIIALLVGAIIIGMFIYATAKVSL